MRLSYVIGDRAIGTIGIKKEDRNRKGKEKQTRKKKKTPTHNTHTQKTHTQKEQKRQPTNETTMRKRKGGNGGVCIV